MKTGLGAGDAPAAGTLSFSLTFELSRSGSGVLRLRNVQGAAQALHGVSAEALEADASLLFARLDADAGRQFEEALRRSAQQQAPLSHVARGSNGSRRLIKGTPQSDGEGASTRWACLELDVTDLDESLSPGARFEAVFEHSFHSTIVFREYRVELCNTACLSLFGYRNAREVSGLSALDFAAPQSHSLISEIMRRRLEEGDRSPLIYEVTAQRADGSTFIAEVRSSTFIHHAQLYVIVMHRDVSEPKRIEHELSENRERLVLAMELSNLGWWELDLINQTLNFGDDLHHLLRTNPTSAPSPMAFETFMRRFVPRELQAQMAQHLVAASIGLASSRQLEQPFIRADGTHGTMLVRVFVRRDEHGRTARVFGVSQDITEQLDSDRRHRELEGQLRHAQKMESVGTLAGGIAHDFNNILTAILSIAEVAKIENPGNAPLQEDLEQIIQSSRRAADLVRQILSFSRRERTQRKVAPLAPIIDEALKLLRSTLPRTLSLEVKLDAALYANVDVTQMHQVVVNLMTNAAQAMANRTGTLAIGLERRNANAALVVRDAGQGMDAATCARIFDPFFTTKPPGEGTGLGLSVVLGIVQDHQGSIGVESVANEGSVFTVLLPLVTPQDAAVAEVEALPTGGGRKVLFVDDEVVVVEATRRLLERLGFHITAFTDARLALSAFERTPDAWDFVVTDLTMPELTGLDLARRIHALRPKLKVWLTSGFSAALDVDRLRAGGIIGVLPKPLSASSFVNV